MAETNRIEHLGSGVPRMLESYSKDCFKFSAHFLRMSFPSAAPVTDLVATDDGKSNETTGGAISRAKLYFLVIIKVFLHC